MRVPRLRFTIRRMMVAVAVVALVAWAGRMLRLSAAYQSKGLGV